VHTLNVFPKAGDVVDPVTSGGRTTRRVPGRLVVIVVAGLIALVGCGPNRSSDSKPSSSTTATVRPSPTGDPMVAQARQSALAAYDGYVRTYALASQVANPDDPNLASYLADPLLSLTRHNIRILKDNGQVQIGAQTATVTSSTVDLATTPPTVTIHACLDYSSLKLVYKSNQSPVPNSSLKNTHISAVVTVARYATGQWLVNDSRQGSDTC